MDRGTIVKLRKMLEEAIEKDNKADYDNLRHHLVSLLDQPDNFPSMNAGENDELGLVLNILNKVWYEGSWPLTNLPGTEDQKADLSNLLSDILALQHFAQAISEGELSSSLQINGLTGETLKKLQAALIHLTWKTQRIAEGDFTQQVDFMNDFSVSFNTITRGLAEAQDQLKGVAKELTTINTNLKVEIAERKRIEAELKRYHALLENLSVTDGLTGIANRRRFDEFLLGEWRRAIRYQTPLSLILLDIDFFKAYNDTYGHIAGDDCLRLIAQGLKEIVQRPGDLLARFGGEEFACVLTVTQSKGALAVARQLVEKIHELNIAHNTSLVADQVTVSLGLATVFPMVGQQPLELIQRADELLYEAKRSGRNRMRSWPEEKKGNFERVD